MLNLVVEDTDLFNEKDSSFTTIKGGTLNLEHSLISVSKWESIWKKPFITEKKMTLEETLSYIKCMTLNPKVDDKIYTILNKNHINKVYAYIADPMTATTISNINKKHSREIITSEVIYYMMFANQIPKECEKWHLNRLMMLLEVFGAKNQPPKKMSTKELMSRNKRLNAARRAATGSKG